jgi:thymidylate synthase (FAD)
LKVKLIGVTQSEDSFIENTEHLVAYIAKVSNPSGQDSTNYIGLIKYLIKNQHWSPFEMVSVVMEITTTRDIARQILRHRSFSFQEFSQRYAQATEFSYREARLQDHKNRQNSIELSDDDSPINIAWVKKQSDISKIVQDTYNWALDQGIAKEQARAVLPEGMTVSKMYMAGTLRSWIHYCQLRMANGTQKEHREIAEQCWEVISYLFPSIKGAYDELLTAK